MKASIIGTVGVPACYGGFETLVEQLVKHSAGSGIDYTVYCSSPAYAVKHDAFCGAALRYVPLKANGLQSVPYDIASLVRAARHSDAVLILGVSGCAFLPLFRKFCHKKLIINIDGLEHRRAKWNKWVKRYLKYSEALALRHCDVVITDNKGVQDYVRNEYGKEVELIAYGGDHVLVTMDDGERDERLGAYGVSAGGYALALCRIEPENNPEATLEAFARTGQRLVFVGNWDNSPYGHELQHRYAPFKNITMAPAVYDLRTLYALRSGCQLYVHGHSAGGTNPSLVEAMFFDKPIAAYDVVYNRETTDGRAIYFGGVDQLEAILRGPRGHFAQVGADMGCVARQRYQWHDIARQYEDLLLSALGGAKEQN